MKLGKIKYADKKWFVCLEDIKLKIANNKCSCDK